MSSGASLSGGRRPPLDENYVVLRDLGASSPHPYSLFAKPDRVHGLDCMLSKHSGTLRLMSLRRRFFDLPPSSQTQGLVCGLSQLWLRGLKASARLPAIQSKTCWFKQVHEPQVKSSAHVNILSLTLGSRERPRKFI